MGLSSSQRAWLQRGAALLLVVLVAPLVLALAAFTEDAPVVAGEPAPRTVFASETVRIKNEAATRQAREDAAASVSPVFVPDPSAQAGIVRETRQVFEAVAAAREPQPVPPGADDEGQPPSPRPPSHQEQIRQLRNRLGDMLTVPQIRRLVRLSDTQLSQLREATVAAVRQLARREIRPDEVETVLAQQLPTELALRDFPGDTGERIAEPLIRSVMGPTMTLDEGATEAAREQRRSQVEDVVEIWRQNEPIVREGEIVDPLELRALEQLGLEGADPRLALLRAAAAMAVIVLVGGLYLYRMQSGVWRSGRRILLLGGLVAGYAVLVAGVSLLVDAASPGWWYAAPVGALAMLAAMLIHPVVGLATMLPGIVLLELMSPQSAGVPLFAAAVVLTSVPLVTSLSSRSELRTATIRTAWIYPALAFVAVLVFGPRDEALVATTAGIANAVVTAMLVQGLLPFLETLFRLPTVTALLDLADRNHPLLRELEQKALGSYNHSVMVAALVERACREIDARPLLGQVAALYHDIGKVRKPHFFIENQRGIANPHDDLEPEVSAVIIQNHVQDGVEMAREFRLPPEVVACIRSHHGTMLVDYFYQKALRRAGGEQAKVDASHYRYKGTKPRSKEAAILVMADCCEAATRARAMDRGTLPREEIESMVDRLLEERVEDGQFDHCDLTFAEMSRVRDSIVEALVGIYHPRIAYPGKAEVTPGPPVPLSTSVATQHPVDDTDSEQSAHSVG